MTLVLSLSCLVPGVVSPAIAHAPTVGIYEPLTEDPPVVLEGSLPLLISLGFAIQHSSPGNIDGTQDLRVTVAYKASAADPFGAPTTLLDVADPFDLTACTAVLEAATTACDVTAEEDSADVKVGFAADQEGFYKFVVSIRHGSPTDLGTDDVTAEVVEEQEIHVAKAPSAMANEHLNSGAYDKKKLTGGVRGCVLKHISGKHAHYSAYGFKGGPYDRNEVILDVGVYLPVCGYNGS